MAARSALGSEDRILDWLREKLQLEGLDRLGDDAAILPAGGQWAVTVDQQIAGVHFPVGLDPALVARRLLAVNLSDLAAMGAQPVYGFLALSGPSDRDVRRFLAALLAACKRFGLELAGGDLAAADQVRSVFILIGRRPRGGRWLRRGAGRVGDSLWVGGPLGLSALGRLLSERGATMAGRRVRLPEMLGLPTPFLRLARRAVRAHLDPRPQLELGEWLGRRRRAAAIDVSDGLAIDLHRLCRESAVGAELDHGRLPLARSFRELCQLLGADPDSLVLGGGEDYVLLFAIPARIRPPTELSCHRVGRLVAGQRVQLIDADGPRPLPAAGWDHFRS